MTLDEAVLARHSVRNYQDKKISENDLRLINSMIDICNSEGNLNFKLLEDAGDTFNRLLNKAMGLASAPSVIACIGKDDETLDERIGYYGEKIVLYAQQLGLNTCWAGTFNKKKIPVEVATDERLPIVIAIGYGANPGRIRKSKTIDQVVKGDVNLMPDWFINGVKYSLLAPTAVNQQKFMFELNGDSYNLFDKGGILSKIDLGIVRYHFEIGAKLQNK